MRLRSVHHVPLGTYLGTGGAGCRVLLWASLRSAGCVRLLQVHVIFMQGCLQEDAHAGTTLSALL